MDNIFNSLCAGVKFKHNNNNREALKLFSSHKDRSNDTSKISSIFQEKNSGLESSLSKKRLRSNSIEQEEPQSIEFEKDEEVNAFRNRLQIKVKGHGKVENPVTSFYDMNIHRDVKSTIIKNIEKSDWKEPTPIQMQSIPILLNNHDILATAPTGSGKTAAYLLPALSILSKSTSLKTEKGIKVLVIAPTKELVDQIHREANRLCNGRRYKISVLKKTIVTTAIARQDKNLLAGVDMLISTPLRLLSLIRLSLISLSLLQLLILDEADKLFEKPVTRKREREKENNNANKEDEREGEDDDKEERERESISSSFLNQMDEILTVCPQNNLQKALFSATLGPLVQELASSFLSVPISVRVGAVNAAANTIKQRLVFVGREDGKLLAIRQLIQSGLRPPVLLFVQSVDRARELYRELVYDGVNVDLMHADRTAQQRDEVIMRFRRGDIWILICTDLMGRGVDFRGVRMVINYDLPLTPVSYIHRIGRTGRAGREGEAVSLFTESDLSQLRSIANVMKLSGCEVPDWILSIKPLNTKQKRIFQKSSLSRPHISTEIKQKKKKEKKNKREREREEMK